MAVRRKGWGKRSASYRARLIGAGRSGKLSGSPMPPGETRAYWERGGDLRAGRSHAPSYATAAPADATARVLAGEGTDADRRHLSTWRSLAPGWVPRSRTFMADDVAAALSSLPPPDRWAHFDLYWQNDGSWRMVVQMKNPRAYDREIVLPDYTAAKNVMDMASLVAPNMKIPDPGVWDQYVEEGRDFDVYGSD